MKRKLIYSAKMLVLLLTITIFFHPSNTSSQIKMLDDEELRYIHGQVGVDIWSKDISLDIGFQGWKYIDTDTGNALEFNYISIYGGTTDPVTGLTDGFEHPAYFDDGFNPISYDFFTVNDPALPINGQTIFSLSNPDWTQYLYFRVENFVFCTHDLGVLNIGNIANRSSYFYLTPHGGPSWEYQHQLNIDEIEYIYSGEYETTTGVESFDFYPFAEEYRASGPFHKLKTAYESLKISGIHFAESAAGTTTDPSTWTFSGYFTIGDLFNTTTSNPAMMDVFTRADNNKTVMYLSLPMTGSLRIENVNFGGTDFGPCAIDGINVHRLHVEISP